MKILKIDNRFLERKYWLDELDKHKQYFLDKIR